MMGNSTRWRVEQVLMVEVSGKRGATQRRVITGWISL